jgi:RNA polymerase sigma-70 factor, ECF subfamily
MSVAHPNDFELAQRVAAGEELAATELVQMLSGEMFGFTRKMIGDSNSAEDVLQDTLMGILRSIDRYNGSTSLRTWGFSILRHKIVDAHRKRGRDRVVASVDPESDQFDSGGHWKDGVTLDPWNENAEIVEVVRRCMEKLPDNQREALHLRAMDGLSAREVAEVLEMSYANLRQVLHRGRKAVRRCADQALGTSFQGDAA